MARRRSVKRTKKSLDVHLLICYILNVVKKIDGPLVQQRGSGRGLHAGK